MSETDNIIDRTDLLQEAEKILLQAAATGNAAFSSSLSAEDQLITDMIARSDLNIVIFTLDTGRLHQETYELLSKSERFFGVPIHVLYPDHAELEKHVRDHGINGFYDGIEIRQECCRIRKVEPLKRALSGKSAWVTGLRQDQSSAREDIQGWAFDSSWNLWKASPLIHWSNEAIWEEIKHRKIPVNTLHQKGYPSIGCSPCTRAVYEGEDIRAGRWWWESHQKRECGIHVNR